MVTTAQLKKLFPGAKAALVAAIVSNWSLAEAAGIDANTNRMCGFFASIGTETGGLKATEENLNYTTVKQLRKTWPKRFPSDAAAKPYVRNPQALAILVYGGRMGNAASPSTDGWDFRGGGMMQTTGREGYRKLGFEQNPAALRDPVVAFKTAVREWSNRGCNAIADRGDQEGVRRAINGGLNGIAEFKAYWRKAATVFKDSPPVVASLMSVPEPVEVRPAPDQLVENKTFDDEATILAVQTKLRDLGYAEVGPPDGKIGDFTRKAIVLYRGDKGLPYSDKIDAQLLVTLLPDTEKRKQPEGRADATPAMVRERVPEVKGNWLGKIWARITAAGGMGVAAVSAAYEKLPDASEYLAPVKNLAGDVPTWFWFVVVGVAAFLLSRQFAKGEQAGVEAFQQGARR